MTDDEIQSRIDELIAELTPAEKAGQLTQYFYFGSLPETDAEQIAQRPPSEQATMVEAVLRRGEAGSLLFVTDPTESTDCSGSPSKATGWAFQHCSGST
jgi:beta-glucosidase